MRNTAVRTAGGALPEAIHRHFLIGCPDGVDPAEWRRALEARIEVHLTAATRLLDALDRMEADPDLEPSLGWTPWCTDPTLTDLEGDDSDLEPDCDYEDGGNDEPSLGWVTEASGLICFGRTDDLEDERI